MEAFHALVRRSGVLVECPVVVEDVYEGQLVPHTDVVVVRVVRGGDLHGTSSELHVDGDGVGDNGDASVEEGVDSEFAVQVLDHGRDEEWNRIDGSRERN